MTVRVSADLTSACPRGCSGHGQCLQGQCQCSPGYIGQDCALSKYSVLFCLSVAPGTASAFRASASAAPDTSDRTVRSVSIVQCFLPYQNRTFSFVLRVKSCLLSSKQLFCWFWFNWFIASGFRFQIRIRIYEAKLANKNCLFSGRFFQSKEEICYIF